MREVHLNHAIARATGEDPSFIRQRGFSIVEDESALCDSDIEALMNSWDELEAEFSINDFMGMIDDESTIMRMNPHESGHRTKTEKKSRKQAASSRSKTRLPK